MWLYHLHSSLHGSFLFNTMRFTCRAMISLLFKPSSLLSVDALCAVTFSTCSVLILLTHISAWLWYFSLFYMNNFFFLFQHTEIAWGVIYEFFPIFEYLSKCHLDSWWVQALEEMLNIFMGFPGPKWNPRSETTSRQKRTGWSPTRAMQKTAPLQQGQKMCEHSCVK